MFNSKHYVPILRWKMAEKEALKELGQKEKKMITPLLELIMPPRQRPEKGKKKKTEEEHKIYSINKLKSILPKLPEEILKYWGKSPIFVDLNLLVNVPLKEWGYREITSLGKKLNISVIPAIRLDDNTKIENSVINLAKQYKNGLCLRILCSDLAQASIGNRINQFILQHKIQKENVDLLVDFELVEKMPESQYSIMVKQLNNIGDIEKWRTFTVASGAFPFNLSHLIANNTYRIPRSDWAYWLNKIYFGSIKRKPAFADYTIQHPIYVEPNPSANPSASIRYTSEDNWVIVRGEALIKENGAGHAQYPSQAKLLTLEKEFKGKEFSYGDAYIAEKAQDINTPNTGNPRTWLRAGVNHHLVLVAHQVANLP